MIVVSVAAKTGIAMRRAAFSAAATGCSPRRRARKSACSPTTMASSTTMPRVMIRPKRLIMLSVSPAAYISAMAANIAAGMPAATQKAMRAFRNRNSRHNTSPSPISPLSIRMSSRPVIASARVRIRSMRHARRQHRLHLGRDLLDPGLDLDGIAPVRAVDADRDRRVVADEIAAIAVHPLDADPRHVADRQFRAVGVRAQHDAGDVGGRALLAAGAHPGIGRRHLARRDRRRPRRRWSSAISAMPDVMGDQVDRGHLDDGAWRGDAADRAAGDPRREQPRHEFVGEAAQLFGRRPAR